MKTPLSYYGGKQRLAKHIVSIIPDHLLYTEPFIGGGAVFFKKNRSKIEVLNDTNREMINFYQIVKNDFVGLEKKIRISLHSRDLHRKAEVINKNPDMFTELDRAWAVWTLCSQSFASKLDGTFGFDLSVNTTTKKIANKRENFTEEYAIRLQNVTLECMDALYVIQSRDTADAFHYCDPPYYQSDMGHYDGYTIEDFEHLLQVLSKVKGKFLLSSYPSEILTRYTREFGWFTQVFEQGVSVNTKSGYQKKKWEVLTANYPIDKPLNIYDNNFVLEDSI